MKRSRFASWTAALAAIILAASPLEAAENADKLVPLTAEQKARAAELAKPISVCIRRQDTDNPSFHGCIDWHSSVHATAALVAYTHATGDQRYIGLVKEALASNLIAEERQNLRDRPAFEMPYGRAWFLRLALEYRSYFGDDALKPFADDILASLLARYAHRAPNPRSVEYASDSWALINMYDYAAATGNDAALATIRDLVRKNFIESERACDYDLEAGGFMAVCTNWAWLASKVLTRDEIAPWAKNFFQNTGGLPEPVTDPDGAHHSGLNFSRAWGLHALYEATSDERYERSYRAHFDQTYDNPDQWRGAYHTVAHWVPQFGMFALLGLDRK